MIGRCINEESGIIWCDQGETGWVGDEGNTTVLNRDETSKVRRELSFDQIIILLENSMYIINVSYDGVFF